MRFQVPSSLEDKGKKPVGDLGRGEFRRRIIPNHSRACLFLVLFTSVGGFLKCFDSFFQEYMVYRKHTYMRLDGSSKISERRDMVADFQSRCVRVYVRVCV